jgi:hypothetical protein
LPDQSAVLPGGNAMNITDEVAENPYAPGHLTAQSPTDPVVFPRLLIGLIVLICAEVFSGASLHVGLWNPWTLIVTYWLYFAHFFFFTTLAVRTGRTSFWSLYLWGVLFGLYESWITKVIWFGYGARGKFVIGAIGPYGISEISMAFIFHPVMSFILPLAVACLIFPSLRRLFPDLAWLTGTSRAARLVRIYLALSLIPTMAFNSGGPMNFLLNLGVLSAYLAVLWHLSRSSMSMPDARVLVVFGRRGFVGLCLYLALLYEVCYSQLTPQGLPSIGVQLLTFVFYAIAILGIMLHRRREPLPAGSDKVLDSERRLVGAQFAIMLILALIFAAPLFRKFVMVPMVLNFVIWALLGFLLTWIAVFDGVWERVTVASGERM